MTDTTSEDDVARLVDRAMAPRDRPNPVDLVAYETTFGEMGLRHGVGDAGGGRPDGASTPGWD